MSQPPDNVLNDDAGTPDLPASDRHRLLATERRRLVLDVLAGNTAPVELDELAAGVVARENGIEAVDEAAIDRVATALHHIHLPKIARFGIIDYNAEAHRIDPIDGPIDAVRIDPHDY